MLATLVALLGYLESPSGSVDYGSLVMYIDRQARAVVSKAKGV